MCNKTNRTSNKTPQLDKKSIISLIKQYCAKKIRMKQMISEIKRSRRQITRMVKCFRTTGTISLTRGFGSHLPYNQEECERLLRLLWDRTNENVIAEAMNVPIKRLKRHIKIISLPTVDYCVEWDKTRDNCTFIVYIESLSMKSSVLRISITININLVEINEKKVDVIEKSNLTFTHQNNECYHRFINWLFADVSNNYFIKFKMRTMDKMTELERIKAFQVYYQDVFNNFESSDLLLNILPIINHYGISNNLYQDIEEDERHLSMFSIKN